MPAVITQAMIQNPSYIAEDIGLAPDQAADPGEALQCRVAAPIGCAANSAVAVAVALSDRCEPAMKCNPVGLEQTCSRTRTKVWINAVPISLPPRRMAGMGA